MNWMNMMREAERDWRPELFTEGNEEHEGKRGMESGGRIISNYVGLARIIPDKLKELNVLPWSIGSRDRPACHPIAPTTKATMIAAVIWNRFGTSPSWHLDRGKQGRLAGEIGNWMRRGYLKMKGLYLLSRSRRTQSQPKRLPARKPAIRVKPRFWTPWSFHNQDRWPS